VQKNINDGALALSLWQSITPNMNIYGRFKYQGGNGDDVKLMLTGNIPCIDMSYELAYERMLNANTDNLSDLTAFYRVLGAWQPYDDINLMIHKPLTKELVLSFQAEYHNAHNDEKFTSNRDFELFSVSLADENIWKGFGGQVALERWYVHGGEGTWAVTGEATKKWKCLQAALGVDFQKYEDKLVLYNPWARWLDQLRIALLPGMYETYNPFVIFFDKYVAEQHNNIYSIYARTKWAINPDQDLSLRVTVERDDEPESPYWRVQAAYEIRF
jgi:hypothetical protein